MKSLRAKEAKTAPVQEASSGSDGDLRARLQEAEDTLEAIRAGAVDALVVSGPDGERVYTLKSTDEPYRVIVQTMNEGAATLGADGTILYCNRRLSAMLGLPIEKVIGTPIFRYLPLRERDSFADFLSRAGEGNARRETTLTPLDGSALPVNISTNPLQLDGARNICAVITDLTEPKRAEAALQKAHDELEMRVIERTAELRLTNDQLSEEIEERTQIEEELRVVNDELMHEVAERQHAEEAVRESEERFRTLFETMTQGVILTDTDGLAIAANPAAERILGVSLKDLLESTPHSPRWNVIREDGTKITSEDVPLAVAMRTQSPVHDAVMGVHNPVRNEFRWLRTTIIPKRAGTGEVVGAYSIFQDITERKLAQAEIASTALFPAESPDPTLRIAGDGQLLYVNPVAESLLHALAGRADVSAVPAEWREAARQALDSGTKVEFEYRCRDGCYYSFVVVPIPEKGYANLYGRDISKRKVAEEALRMSEERSREQSQQLQAIMDAVPGGIFLAADRTCTVITGNPGAYKLLNMPIGSNVSQTAFQPETHWQEFKEGRPLAPQELPMQRAARGEEVRDFEMDLVFEDGAVKTVICDASPICGPDREIVGAVASMTDITERKRAEEALRASQTLLRAVMESTDDPVYVKDRESRILMANPALGKVVGVPLEEMFGRTDTEYYGDDPTGHNLREHDLQVMNTGQSAVFEETVPTVDGPRTFLSSKAPYRDAAGRIIGVIGISRDITERKQVEDQLRLQADIMASVNDAVIAMDLSFHITSWNEAAEQIYGWKAEEVLGKPIRDVLRYQFSSEEMEAARRTLASGNPVTVESVQPTRDGRHVVIENYTISLQDSSGAIVGYVAVNRDITERKQAEDALRESEERFRVMADGTPMMIWTTDGDGRVEFVNRAYCEFFGVTQESMRRHGWQPLVHPDDAAAYAGAFAVSLRNHEPFRAVARVRRKDGAWPWVESFGEPRFSASGEFLGIGGSSPDITERKDAEEEIERTGLRLRQIIDLVPHFIFAKDIDGHFLLANEAVARAYGTTVEDLVGRTDADFNPDTKEVEWFLANDRAVISSGQPKLIPEEKITTADGQQIYLQTIKIPFTFSEINKPAVLGVSTNITERKRAEEIIRRHNEVLEHMVAERTAQIQKLERQRQENEKQAAIGRMAARIAHEINNPLAGVKNSFLLVKRAIPPDYTHYEFVGRIDKELDRIARIVRQMFEIYKPERTAEAIVDVANTVRDVAALLSGNAKQQGVTLDLDMHAACEHMRLHEDSLRQVLFNLIQNAIEASPQGGKVRVSAHCDDDVLSILVADRGCGIPPEVAAHIFEPFYTTKSDLVGGGLGLGLSITKGVVEAMGGVLSFESEINKGTTFQVVLPVNQNNKEQ